MPYVFNMYIDELSACLNNVLTRCIFNSVWVNHVFYGDDAVLLAPSSQAMQTLVKICDEFAASHELIYNVKKTFCICIRPKWLKNLIVRNLYLSEKVVNMTTTRKYLGMFIIP